MTKIKPVTSVLIPVKFFSWYKFPLKNEEIRRYLWRLELSKEEVQKIIDRNSLLENKNGLTSIDVKGKEREQREARAGELWETVEKWRLLFSWIPFITQVCVSNTLAYNNAGGNSDIDLLIIAKPGRVWTARAILLVIMNLFKIRVQSIDKWNKFSPEFFLSENFLNIKDLSIENDYYLSYWLADLVPIWPDGEHRKFRHENRWFKENLPNAWLAPKLRKDFVTLKPNIFRIILEKILSTKWSDELEERLYRKQRQIILRNTKRLGVNPSVVINRDIIKVHFNDRREIVRDAIKETLNQMVAEDKPDHTMARFS